MPNQDPLRLRLSRLLKSRADDLISDVMAGLPELPGGPVALSVQPELTAHRGKLLSGSPHRGTAVRAATFIRSRKIVLESELLPHEDSFRLILVHELFHFAWPRLANRDRYDFSQLLEREWECGARGELGESADVKKETCRLVKNVSAALWRDYVCEAFCDTAAFLYAGVSTSQHFALARRWTAKRADWFARRYTSDSVVERH